MTLDTLLAEAAAHPIVGWDFSWPGQRLTTSELPWDFAAILEERARQAPDLLDMDTGGGERLAALAHRPPRTVATESWPPNVGVATRRLHPLGVTVVAVEEAPENAKQDAASTTAPLPFAAESFSLVSNRHGSFFAEELARILTPGGVFLTQQVGDEADPYAEALGLPLPERPPWNLGLAVAQVTRAGLRVEESAEALQTTTFADVGAFAWYLAAVPWTVPGFAIDTHRAELEQVHARIERDGALELRRGAFWLAARKGGR